MNTSSVATLAPGSRFMLDGKRWTVVELGATRAMIQATETGERRSVTITNLLSAPGSRMLVAQPPAMPAVAPILASLSEKQKAAVEKWRRHVLEVLTGYQSGTPEDGLPGEPRPEYNAATRKKMDRYKAKAKELGVSVPHVRNQVAGFKRHGDFGLVDGRILRQRELMRGIAWEWLDMLRSVIADQVKASRRTRTVILTEVERRLKTQERETGIVVPIPKLWKARRILAEETRGTNTFTGSTKGKRSIANRPVKPYGHLRATRPGEYIIVDTTLSDVFAMDPMTLRWVQVFISIAMDLFSRCITAIRLTPFSAKAVDAAMLLYETICPNTRARSDTGILPYTGVPSLAVYDAAKLLGRDGLPDVVPETAIHDLGKIYISRHLYSVGRRFGISFQPARPWAPTDKAWGERFFRTLTEDCLAPLPGYKGPDVYSRGERVENEAYYFIHELEDIIRDWIVKRYHQRPQRGLIIPSVPKLELTPIEMLEEGIGRAGYLRVLPRADLAYDFLAVAWRTIQHYGVEIGYLKFNGDALKQYVNKTCRHIDGRRESGRDEKEWPFFYDPDDMRQIHFQDPKDHGWHVLRCTQMSEVPVPFSMELVEYARRLAVKLGRHHEVPTVLMELLQEWNAGLTGNRTERRMALRLSQQRDARLKHDAQENNETEAVARVHARFKDGPSTRPVTPIAGDDDDAEDLQAPAADDPEHYYDDALETIK